MNIDTFVLGELPGRLPGVRQILPEMGVRPLGVPAKGRLACGRDWIDQVPSIIDRSSARRPGLNVDGPVALWVGADSLGSTVPALAVCEDPTSFYRHDHGM